MTQDPDACWHGTYFGFMLEDGQHLYWCSDCGAIQKVFPNINGTAGYPASDEWQLPGSPDPLRLTG